MNCKLCASKMNLIWKVKNSPVVNNYRKKSYSCLKTNSNIYFCYDCQSMSNIHKISLNKIFENYSYSSFDNPMVNPIIHYITGIIKKKAINSLLEVGCNNGVFLEKLSKKNKDLKMIVGIDPSSPENTNYDNRITYKKELFNKEMIVKNNFLNCFDMIICRHMFAHNPDPNIIAKSISRAIKQEGYIYIENASFFETVKNKDFSQLYLEHYFSLSPLSIEKIFENFGFKIIDLKEFNIHNGSFGVLLKKTEISKLSDSEKFNRFTYNETRKKIIDFQEKTIKFFKELPRENVYLWGVSAKTVMILNIFNINIDYKNNVINGAVDFSKNKINKFVPGTNIFVYSEHDHKIPEHANIIIGARNFKKELITKINQYLKNPNIIIPPF